MAKANHLWGNHSPDKRHGVDSIGVLRERERKPRENLTTRGFTTESMSRMLPRPILAQDWCRGKVKWKGGFRHHLTASFG